MNAIIYVRGISLSGQARTETIVATGDEEAIKALAEFRKALLPDIDIQFPKCGEKITVHPPDLQGTIEIDNVRGSLVIHLRQ